MYSYHVVEFLSSYALPLWTEKACAISVSKCNFIECLFESSHVPHHGLARSAAAPPGAEAAGLSPTPAKAGSRLLQTL